MKNKKNSSFGFISHFYQGITPIILTDDVQKFKKAFTKLLSKKAAIELENLFENFFTRIIYDSKDKKAKAELRKIRKFFLTGK